MQFRKVYTEREATAFHEAGHAVMAYLKKIRIIHVTIVENQREGSLGHLLYSGKLTDGTVEGITPEVITRLKNQIAVALSGFVAEYLFTGKWNKDAAMGDFAIVDSILPYLEEAGKPDFIENEIKKTHDELEKTEHWKMITGLAEYLLDINEFVPGKTALEILKEMNKNINQLDLTAIQQSLNKNR